LSYGNAAGRGRSTRRPAAEPPHVIGLSHRRAVGAVLDEQVFDVGHVLERLPIAAPSTTMVTPLIYLVGTGG
jgi:hypothetical protein